MKSIRTIVFIEIGGVTPPPSARTHASSMRAGDAPVAAHAGSSVSTRRAIASVLEGMLLRSMNTQCNASSVLLLLLSLSTCSYCSLFSLGDMFLSNGIIDEAFRPMGHSELSRRALADTSAGSVSIDLVCASQIGLYLPCRGQGTCGLVLTTSTHGRTSLQQHR